MALLYLLICVYKGGHSYRFSYLSSQYSFVPIILEDSRAHSPFFETPLSIFVVCFLARRDTEEVVGGLCYNQNPILGTKRIYFSAPFLDFSIV